MSNFVFPPQNQLNKGLAKNLSGTPVAINATATNLVTLTILNNQGAAAYIQLFDNANPTPGATQPDLEYLVAANSAQHLPFPKPFPFANAAMIAATTTESGSTGSADGVMAFWTFE